MCQDKGFQSADDLSATMVVVVVTMIWACSYQVYIAKTQVGIHMSLPSGCNPNWSKYLLQKHKLELIETFEVVAVQIN